MRVIDSHTAGEPTRVIIDGGPDLGNGSVKERAKLLEKHHKDFCQSVLMEPRGSEAMVGAYLQEPSNPECVAGVIYFNRSQNLGMCGHAAIGLAVTLARLGRIGPGTHKLETPVGVVEVLLKDHNSVSVVNIESYRLHKAISIDVDDHGKFTGDVAWGGNWFFLIENSPIPLEMANIPNLTEITKAIRNALERNNITGENGAQIDHIELFGPAKNPNANSRNFVLCPDDTYDRSPCGTGCSAKIACLAADGKLEPNELWIQESIIGSTYEISYAQGVIGVVPTISGEAFVTSEAMLIFNDADPYKNGIK